ncbi:unnamed protein product [Danaus chrysippus]|uniref:(African queen) hypothetical protein n=1 Tax=Danaus chrysippus TaxID=151541 RepID=A0A8J2WAQ4_9NEOP|nr:unnamed protein product [Danaus chrysippus]
MEQCKEKLYPNCDNQVWLRSCEVEVNEPITGEITGDFPRWIRGSLIRNGPGSLKVGSMRFKHLFDSSALLHRFNIQDGQVTYQCRFLRSNTYNRNMSAGRIVVTDFGTQSVPDPCHSIFDRFATLFSPGDALSDNAMISVYPFGDEMYAFTEGPVIHRINPVTLDTMERKNLMKSVALVNHTSHPHVMSNGDVYNVGMSLVKGRLRHVVVKFPFMEKGITANYFVIIEQPLSVSICRLVHNQLRNRPLASSLKWYQEHKTNIVLISRESGKEVKRYETETLFFLHIINCYEAANKLIVDLCSYKDPKILDAMYIQAIETMQSNANYAEWFRGRPKRIEIDLNAPDLTHFKPRLLADLGCETPRIYYDAYNGKTYRYFYAISSDVDAENPGLIIKVDTVTGQTKTWFDNKCYPSEPVFVPRLNGKSEDDGVLLTALVMADDSYSVSLVCLCAVTLKELARCTFKTPSPTPKCLHGWFLPDV